MAISGYKVASWPWYRWTPWAVCDVGLAINSNIPSKPLQSHLASDPISVGKMTVELTLIAPRGCFCPEAVWLLLRPPGFLWLCVLSSVSFLQRLLNKPSSFCIDHSSFHCELRNLDWIKSLHMPGTERNRTFCFQWLALASLDPLYTLYCGRRKFPYVFDNSQETRVMITSGKVRWSDLLYKSNNQTIRHHWTKEMVRLP